MKNSNRTIKVHESKLLIKGRKDIVKSILSVLILSGYFVILAVAKPDKFSYTDIFMYLFVFLFILYALYTNVVKRLIIDSERVIEKYNDRIVVNEKTYEDIRSVYVSHVTTVTASLSKYYVVGFKYFKNRIKSVPLATSSKDEAFDMGAYLADFLGVELIDETDNMSE